MKCEHCNTELREVSLGYFMGPIIEQWEQSGNHTPIRCRDAVKAQRDASRAQSFELRELLERAKPHMLSDYERLAEAEHWRAGSLYALYRNIQDAIKASKANVAGTEPSDSGLQNLASPEIATSATPDGPAGSSKGPGNLVQLETLVCLIASLGDRITHLRATQQSLWPDGSAEARKFYYLINEIAALGREGRDAVKTATAIVSQDQPWSLDDVLAQLVQAAEHLLRDHACDAHGYESLTEAVRVARARYIHG